MVSVLLFSNMFHGLDGGSNTHFSGFDGNLRRLDLLGLKRKSLAETAICWALEPM
jgi:hypothetical protein